MNREERLQRRRELHRSRRDREMPELQRNCSKALAPKREKNAKRRARLTKQATVKTRHARDSVARRQNQYVTLCTYQSFAPPPPMRANEGPDQGIRLKFCPQGRGISFASIKLLFYVIMSI